MAAGTTATRNSSGQFVKKKPARQEHQYGAQVLLQKPTITKTATETSQYVNVQVSTEVTQTLVHACIAQILYRRNLYPRNCFQERFYAYDGPEYKYEEWARGEQGSTEGTGGYTRSLKKGVSGRVDQLLGLLEHGVFDALERGYLKTLYINILEDPEHPADLLERWTLTVEYFLSADGKRATSFNLQKNNEQAAKVTLRTVKQSLNNFTVALTELCAALPELPEDRYMTLDIGYTDDRPPEYFAPGFTHSVRDSVRFPSNDDWEKKTTYVATAYTGRHAIGLQATHLLARDSNLEDALPSALGCTLESSMQDGVTADLSKKAMALVKPHPNSKAARRTDLSPSPLEDYALSEPHTIRSRIHSGALGRTSTKDRHEQQQIRDMLSSPTRVSNHQATQVVRPRSFKQSEQETVAKVVVIQAKLHQLDKERRTTIDPRQERIITHHQHMEKEVTVRCECGYDGEEGQMFLCEFCGHYQHVHCYGYIGEDDTRLSATQVCFSCLLAGEMHSLQQLGEHALVRRALWLLQQRSFEDSKELSQVLGCDDKAVANMKKELGKCGVIVTGRGSTKKDKQRISISLSPAAKGVMEQTYFNPTWGISHHLEGSAEVDERSSVTVTSKKRTLEDTDVASTPAKRVKPFGSAILLSNAEVLNTPKGPRHH